MSKGEHAGMRSVGSLLFINTQGEGMSIDTTDERLTLCVEAVRVTADQCEDPHQAHNFIKWASGSLPQELTDFVGMAGGGRAQVKGMFTRTTYADRLENETEYGYTATADRITRNVLRNWKDAVDVSG